MTETLNRENVLSEIQKLKNRIYRLETSIGHDHDLRYPYRVAKTVKAETTWGIASAVGISGAWAREDHTHGTPVDPALGSISATIFDAKGDLLAGTGNDTYTRLGVGANRRVLIADSTTATGLKWDWYIVGVSTSNQIELHDHDADGFIHFHSPLAGETLHGNLYQDSDGTKARVTLHPAEMGASSARLMLWSRNSDGSGNPAALLDSLAGATEIKASQLLITTTSPVRGPVGVDPVGADDLARKAYVDTFIRTASNTVVTEQTSGQSSTSGVATTYSRGDHTHGSPVLPTSSTTVVNEFNFGQSSTAGVATTFSRGDHTHGTPATPVTSFNTRTGAVTLSSGDVTGALGYTPVNRAGDTGMSGDFATSGDFRASTNVRAGGVFYGGTNASGANIDMNDTQIILSGTIFHFGNVNMGAGNTISGGGRISASEFYATNGSFLSGAGGVLKSENWGVQQLVGHGAASSRTVNGDNSAYLNHEAWVHIDASDMSIKRNVKALSKGEAIAKLRTVEPFTYEWASDIAPPGKRIGLSANSAPPEVTRQMSPLADGTQLMGLDSAAVSALLWAALREIDERLVQIETRKNN